MFTLYEVTNGYTGESYVRCYVWTDAGEAAALDMAGVRFAEENRGRYPEKYHTRLRAVPLFNAGSPEFATAVADDGWVEYTPNG